MSQITDPGLGAEAARRALDIAVDRLHRVEDREYGVRQHIVDHANDDREAVVQERDRRAGQSAFLEKSVYEAVVLKKGGPCEILDQDRCPEGQQNEGKQYASEPRSGAPKAGRQHIGEDDRNRCRHEADDERVGGRAQQQWAAQHGQEMFPAVGRGEADNEREGNDTEDPVKEAHRREQPKAVAKCRQGPTPTRLAWTTPEGARHGRASLAAGYRNSPLIARAAPFRHSQRLPSEMVVEGRRERHARMCRAAASPRGCPC